MSALKALKAARECGVHLETDGKTLSLRAAAAPPSEVVALLSVNKGDVIALLQPAADGWSAEDWLAFFDERAALAEFDGGVPREEARSPRLCLLRHRMAKPRLCPLAFWPLPSLRKD